MEMLFLVLGLSLTYVSVESQMNDRLYANLMKTDFSNTIPRSSDDPVVLKLGVQLVDVRSIDTDTGDATIEFWMQYMWLDRRLTWSKRKYNNIDVIRLPANNIWRPDIELYNGDMKSSNSLAVLYKTGELNHIPRTVVSVRCDVSNYRQDDTVTCSAKFGSWTYNGDEIDLQLMRNITEVDLSEFRSGSWSLESSSLVRNVKYYSCCPEPFPDVTVTLVFRDTKQSGWSFW